MTGGKWVTHGILFDVNSDKIKGESYGTLKSVATVLKENAELKVKIIGHTDSDGDDAKNLDLSKRRAASVKAMLATESCGKVNNRRLELINNGSDDDRAPPSGAGQATAKRAQERPLCQLLVQILLDCFVDGSYCLGVPGTSLRWLG
jgi:outer membrane protein OmpA-like peptidoglycan-associated protein